MNKFRNVLLFGALTAMVWAFAATTVSAMSHGGGLPSKPPGKMIRRGVYWMPFAMLMIVSPNSRLGKPNCVAVKALLMEISMLPRKESMSRRK